MDLFSFSFRFQTIKVCWLTRKVIGQRSSSHLFNIFFLRVMLHKLSVVLLFGKGLLYTKGGTNPTFASAKVKNAIGRIGIFALRLALNLLIQSRGKILLDKSVS